MNRLKLQLEREQVEGVGFNLYQDIPLGKEPPLSKEELCYAVDFMERVRADIICESNFRWLESTLSSLWGLLLKSEDNAELLRLARDMFATDPLEKRHGPFNYLAAKLTDRAEKEAVIEKALAMEDAYMRQLVIEHLRRVDVSRAMSILIKSVPLFYDKTDKEWLVINLRADSTPPEVREELLDLAIYYEEIGEKRTGEIYAWVAEKACKDWKPGVQSNMIPSDLMRLERESD